KTVEIIFPMLCRGELFSLSLDDGASFIPVRREKTMLIYGDSITHGYDAIHPADHYTEIMARTLGYSVYNLGIGGEMFNPGLAACGYPVTPDVILTAYGTNDWSNLPAETLEPNTWGFFRTLREKFPDSRIVALTPVERGDSGTPRKYGSFDRIAALLKTVAAEIPGMDAVDCTAFIPKDPAYFSPDFLHPVDRGFAPYADGVIAALKKLGL
ncbi:MAG: GDSL-type esterase/lipase family protein, partial [Clostridia bacterium]|nr:GDSL-type esterase/lipase family protein [Clostridia bacterium]